MMSGKQGLLILFVLIVLKVNNAYKNGLDRVRYSRVLNDIKGLIPKKEKSKPGTYSKEKLVLFIDKECSNNKHKKLFHDILNRHNNCIYMINKENDDGIYHTDHDWFIFVQLNDTIKCLNNSIINYRHYCITNFRYSSIFFTSKIQSPKCAKNKNTYQYEYLYIFGSKCIN